MNHWVEPIREFKYQSASTAGILAQFQHHMLHVPSLYTLPLSKTVKQHFCFFELQVIAPLPSLKT